MRGNININRMHCIMFISCSISYYLDSTYIKTLDVEKNLFMYLPNTLSYIFSSISTVKLLLCI